VPNSFARISFIIEKEANFIVVWVLYQRFGSWKSLDSSIIDHRQDRQLNACGRMIGSNGDTDETP
jgi:hypothetical protein